MRKCFRFFHPAVVMIAMLMVAGGIAVAQEDITTVEDSAFDTLSRPPAAFNHEEHMEITDGECYVCHHVYDDEGELVEDESSEDFECSECHTPEGSRNLELVVRYHQRCKSCHENEGAGPVVCSGCHVK